MLRAGALRAAARTPQFSPAALPPLVLAFRYGGTNDPADPQNLLVGCVEVTPAVHPALDEHLVRAGVKRVNANTYLLPSAAEAAPVALALAGVPVRIVDPSSKRLVRDTAALGPYAALFSDRPRRSSSPAGVHVRLHAQRRGLSIVFVTDGLLGRRTLDLLGASRRVPARRVNPLEAARLLAEASAASLPCAGYGDAASLDTALSLVSRRLTLETHDLCPAHVSVEAGDGLTDHDGSVLLSATVDPAAALHKLSTAPEDAALAVSEQADDLLRIASARATCRPGLRDYQDVFVSRYVATEVGLVNALRPGLGKTVCAAAALREKAALAGTGVYRALVVVPASLRLQWREELSRFFPEARVCVYDSKAEVAASGAGPLVILATPDLVSSRSAEFAAVEWDDLVVDEANFLRNPDSKRSRALWDVRSRSARALVMTGTPEQASLEDLAALVRFARADASLFAAVGLADSAGALSAAGVALPANADPVSTRVGGLVFRHAPEAQLPRIASRIVALEGSPGRARQALESLLKALCDFEAAVSGGGAGEAARLKVQLTQQLRQFRAAACAADAGGSKIDALVEILRGAHDAGSRSLIMCEFLEPIEQVLATAERAGLAGAALTGSDSARVRHAKAAALQSGELGFLVLSGAGQVGLNLQSASTVVHFDTPATPAAYLQRTSRAARMGSPHAQVDVFLPAWTAIGEDALARFVSQELRAATSYDLACVVRAAAA